MIAAAAAFYVCCAAIRLAYFNVHGTAVEGDRRYYTGLPVTYVALVLPVELYLSTVAGQAPESWRLQSTLLCLGLLFVLRIPVPKPRGAASLVLLVLAALSTALWLARVNHSPTDLGTHANQRLQSAAARTNA